MPEKLASGVERRRRVYSCAVASTFDTLAVRFVNELTK